MNVSKKLKNNIKNMKNLNLLIKLYANLNFS